MREPGGPEGLSDVFHLKPQQNRELPPFISLAFYLWFFVVIVFFFFALCPFGVVLMHAAILISRSLIQTSAERHRPHVCNSPQIPSWDRCWKISTFLALILLTGEENKSMGMKVEKLR